jgi:hypothetical protein
MFFVMLVFIFTFNNLSAISSLSTICRLYRYRNHRIYSGGQRTVIKDWLMTWQPGRFMNIFLNSGEQFHKLETLTLGDDHRGSKTFKHASVVLGVFGQKTTAAIYDPIDHQVPQNRLIDFLCRKIEDTTLFKIGCITCTCILTHYYCGFIQMLKYVPR